MNECPNCLDNSIIPNFRNFRDKMFLRVKNMIQFKWISNQFPLIQFMRFSQQVYWGALPFPPLVDHIFSELSSKTHLSWVALHGMLHSFIELCAPLPQQGGDPWKGPRNICSNSSLMSIIRLLFQFYQVRKKDLPMLGSIWKTQFFFSPFFKI